MAMGLKLQKNPARVYTMLGDGELQEGEVWEAAMCGAHHKLDNLCAMIDYNKLQSDNSQRRDHAAGAAGREMARLRLGGGRDRRP